MTVEQKTNGEQKDDWYVFNQFKRLVNNTLFSRSQLMDRFLDPRRDINDECGYPDTERLTIQDYKRMYDRNPIATRVVEVTSQESWMIQPEVFETEDSNRETEFEKAWDSLGSQLRGTGWFHSELGSSVWEYLLRADRLSGIGSYGVLLLGIDDGKGLEEPVDFGKGDRKLLYLRVFDQSLLDIVEYETDAKNSRFGQPVQYNIMFSSAVENTHQDTKKVHWTRLIHVTDNRTSSEIFGVPRQRPVFNRLMDLQKLYGGSAEMYWRGAFPGLSIETHPQLGGDVPELLTPEGKAGMRSQMENYMNGLQRYLSLIGMTAKSLAPQVVDPTPQIDAQIKAICIVLGIPKRVFEGSERGELASSQDARAWNARLKTRQDSYLTPCLVVPFVDRLIQVGVLPEPKEYHVRWSDLNKLTEEEQATVAVKRTEAMAKYTQGGVEAIMAPADYYQSVLGFQEDEALAIIEAVMGSEEPLTDFGGQEDESEGSAKVPPDSATDS